MDEVERALRLLFSSSLKQLGWDPESLYKAANGIGASQVDYLWL